MSTPEVKKTITQVDKATKAMAKIVGEVTKVTSELTSLVDTSESLAFDIEAQSSELAAIAVQIQEAERTATAELNIRVLENEDKVLSTLMGKRHLAVISQDKLDSLNDDLYSAQSDNENAVSTAVAAAERTANVTLNSVKTSLTATHEVATAKLEANNDSLTDKVAFLETTVADLKGIIDSERQARVQMSANQATPTINVGGGK